MCGFDYCLKVAKKKKRNCLLKEHKITLTATAQMCKKTTASLV